MKNKTAIIISLILFISLIPYAALAASGTIDSDGTYDINAYGNDAVITIQSGLSVTLTNTSGQMYSNIRIDCVGANTALTVDGVSIDNSSNNNQCALSLTGSGNTLTLVGESTLISGYSAPGIRVEAGTSLIISGSGSVTASGGNFAAGIGGGYERAGGIITISGDAGVFLSSDDSLAPATTHTHFGMTEVQNSKL